MRIGIVGAGNIGGTAARLFAAAGHSVAISNSRQPRTLSALASSLGPNVRAMTAGEAVGYGEVVLLAVPWKALKRLPPPNLFAGKIVIDATNPYTAKGRLLDLDTTSSEVVARQLPAARIVKAFNTLAVEDLAASGRTSDGDRIALFVAGDDAEAKKVVSRLIEKVGFAPVDTGSLREGGRRQQPNSPVFCKRMTVDQAREFLSRNR